MNKNKREPLIDRFGRPVTYLRVSVTDRCNLRCAYCTPQDVLLKKRAEILSFDEITRVIKLMSTLGIKKVRLTGGEPLIRKGIEKLVGMLSEIDGIETLSMTTNATLLKQYAKPLKENGLDRINISLDTLMPNRFRIISGGGELSSVLEGIDAAIDAGLTPVRINTVIMKGINEDELADIIAFAEGKSITLRFIECMPMAAGFDWKAHYLSVADVLKREDIRERVATAAAPEKTDTAAYFLPLKNGNGKVGFISPMSDRFCLFCNRLRLTSDGKLRSCLPAEKDIVIRESLRRNADDRELIELIRQAVAIKPEMGVYDFEKNKSKSMIHIGG